VGARTVQKMLVKIKQINSALFYCLKLPRSFLEYFFSREIPAKVDTGILVPTNPTNVADPESGAFLTPGSGMEKNPDPDTG
jgi:hypothetical protein